MAPISSYSITSNSVNRKTVKKTVQTNLGKDENSELSECIATGSGNENYNNESFSINSNYYTSVFLKILLWYFIFTA